MDTLDQALGLLKRQAELEAGMTRPGEFRLTEEQELQVVRRRLANFPEAMRAVLQAAHALRRPVTEVTASDVESWARTGREVVAWCRKGVGIPSLMARAALPFAVSGET